MSHCSNCGTAVASGERTCPECSVPASQGGQAGRGYPRRPTSEDTDVLGARAAAALVDAVLSVPLFLGTVVAFWGLVGFGTAYLLAVVAVLGYFFLSEGVWDGYTVGKRLFGVRVVTVDGGPCTVGKSVVRNLLRVVDAVGCYAVGFVLMAADDRRRRLGDRVAGTAVVDDDR